MILIPKNWSNFQHYKDRSPPWIKLHAKILNDRAFMSLPIASKALAPLLWLLASESKDGKFNASLDELVFRLRVSEKEISTGIKALIDNGFFIIASNCKQDASNCYQVDAPETERETERETELLSEKKPSDDSFIKFWNAYPKKVGKDKALEAWKKKKPPIYDVLKTLAWQRTSEQWTKDNGAFIPHPATYINRGSWKDEPPEKLGGGAAQVVYQSQPVQRDVTKIAEKMKMLKAAL